MVAFYEAYLHAKNKVYSCVRQKVATYSFLIFIVLFAILKGLEILFDWHFPFKCWTYISLFFILYIILYNKVYKNYGITFCGRVDFARYADYVATNYWKNIQYDIEKMVLRKLLQEAQKKETNLLSEILEKIISNTQNTYQKKYVMDCIFNICDNKNILTYTESYFILMAKEDDDVTHFLIEKIHIWSVNHRDSENILLYLCLLKEFSEKNVFAEFIVYHLVDFMKNDNKSRNKLLELQNEGRCDFLKERYIHRIQRYVEAEKQIKEDIEEDYKKNRKSLLFANNPEREEQL